MVFLSFATLRRPDDVDVFVKAASKGLDAVREEVVAQYPPASAPGAATKGKPSQSTFAPSQGTLGSLWTLLTSTTTARACCNVPAIMYAFC